MEKILILVVAVVALMASAVANAAGYPKGKIDGYEYRWCGCPDTNTPAPLCDYVSTPEQAGANMAARYGTKYYVDDYGARCSSYLVYKRHDPFPEGSWSTTMYLIPVGEIPTLINPATAACRPYVTTNAYCLGRHQTPEACPAGFIEDPKDPRQCICPDGMAYVEVLDSCRVVVPRYNYDDSASCKRGPGVGRPIFPSTGSKRTEIPIASLGPERLALAYDSRRWLPSNSFGPAMPISALPSFGALWESSIHRKLGFDSASGASSVQAWRGSARLVTFNKSGTQFRPNASISDRLITMGANWLYYDVDAGVVEVYDSLGRLTDLWSNGGRHLSFTYSDMSTSSDVALEPGLLIELRDDFGRITRLKHDGPVGWGLKSRIKSLIEASSRETTFTYDSRGRLSRIVWPDQTSRTLLYEDATYTWALTGVLDESSVRINAVDYDDAGRARETRAFGEVDHYTVSWTTAPMFALTDTYDGNLDVVLRDIQWVAGTGTSVTMPNQSISTLGFAPVDGMARLTTASQPAGAGCSASSSALDYDANGNVIRSDDFNGNRSCMAHDMSRNLEVVRVEGLSASLGCSGVLSTGASLPIGSRKTSTQWHPDWKLAVRVSEPGRLTTTVYNGQPDPFNGNLIASCAPASALLPDGKPIVVACRRVEQATTDSNGRLGLAAQIDVGVKSREWTYTYNGTGQMLSANGPRAAGDANDTTTYEYWSDTVFTGADPNAQGHTIGDLKAVTNAANQVTRYTKYNKAGQVLESNDANGVPTVNTYDARQRLLTSTVGATAGVGGETTTYEYWPTGLLKKVTQPDGVSFVKYTYDDAQRLMLVEDHLGNSIKYELDNLGNRTGEAVKDPAGTIRRTLGRGIDALGRVQQLTGRE